MKKLFFSNFLAILIASLQKIKPFINKKFMPWLVEQDSQSSARRVIRCSGKSSAEVLATFWDLLVTNVNFWWPSIHSIFNFISFSGTADQGGGPQKVLSSSIGYLGVEIEKMCSNRGSQKMKKMKKLILSNFFVDGPRVRKKVAFAYLWPSHLFFDSGKPFNGQAPLRFRTSTSKSNVYL